MERLINELGKGSTLTVLADISEHAFNESDKELCNLLSEGYSISETACRCGFSDPNYFSKVFKKVKGVAPSDYV